VTYFWVDAQPTISVFGIVWLFFGGSKPLLYERQLVGLVLAPIHNGFLKGDWFG
jgi:hypothetical protein